MTSDEHKVSAHDAILAVENLHAQFTTERGVLRAVDGVSLELREGETLGIVTSSVPRNCLNSGMRAFR